MSTIDATDARLSTHEDLLTAFGTVTMMFLEAVK
jgi:hypothetical protein